MKIWLVDDRKYLRVTYQEIITILQSGLQPYEWTRLNIQRCIL